MILAFQWNEPPNQCSNYINKQDPEPEAETSPSENLVGVRHYDFTFSMRTPTFMIWYSGLSRMVCCTPANGVSAAFTEADIRKQRMANFPCIIKAGTNPLPVGLLQCKFKAVFAEAAVAGLTGGNKQPDIFLYAYASVWRSVIKTL